jgi:NADH-quinone oxidoreductase subunit N
VVGSMVSLVYYLRVIAAVWMEQADRPQADDRVSGRSVPALAGGAPEAAVVAPASRFRAVPVAIAVLAGAATIVFGILPGPLLDLASDAGAALL